MQVKCKKCKRNLTSETIKMLEGKITKVVCPCDNSKKLVSEYDKVSFDEWMSDLIAKNGVTKY